MLNNLIISKDNTATSKFASSIAQLGSSISFDFFGSFTRKTPSVKSRSITLISWGIVLVIVWVVRSLRVLRGRGVLRGSLVDRSGFWGGVSRGMFYRVGLLVARVGVGLLVPRVRVCWGISVRLRVWLRLRLGIDWALRGRVITMWGSVETSMMGWAWVVSGRTRLVFISTKKSAHHIIAFIPIIIRIATLLFLLFQKCLGK